jgi:hypothetical protein
LNSQNLVSHLLSKFPLFFKHPPQLHQNFFFLLRHFQASKHLAHLFATPKQGSETKQFAFETQQPQTATRKQQQEIGNKNQKLKKHTQKKKQVQNKQTKNRCGQALACNPNFARKPNLDFSAKNRFCKKGKSPKKEETLISLPKQILQPNLEFK